MDKSFRELVWVLPSGRWFPKSVRNSAFHKIIAFVALCMFSVEDAALKPMHVCSSMDARGPGHLVQGIQYTVGLHHQSLLACVERLNFGHRRAPEKGQRLERFGGGCLFFSRKGCKR